MTTQAKKKTKAKSKASKKKTPKTIVSPMGNRVILQRAAPVEVSDGGIIIPPSADGTPRAEGEVVSVGPGLLTPEGQIIPIPLKVGQTVMFSAYGGATVVIDGKDYLVVDVQEILATVEIK